MANRLEHAGLMPATAAVLALLGAAVPVAAQPHPDSFLSAGAGIGFASPFHGDFDFTPLAWDASVRVGKGTARFEAAWSEWRHRRTNEFPIPLVPGTSSPDAGRLRQETTRTSRVPQINLLAHFRTGAIEWFAGGGAGVMVLRTEFRQTPIDCAGATACVAFHDSRSNAGLTAQGVFGADVGVTTALAIFGQARLIILTRDAGTSDLRYAAGARWRF